MLLAWEDGSSVIGEDLSWRTRCPRYRSTSVPLVVDELQPSLGEAKAISMEGGEADSSALASNE